MGRYDVQPCWTRISGIHIREMRMADTVTDLYQRDFGVRANDLPESVQRDIREYLADGPKRLGQFLHRYEKSSGGGHHAFMMRITVHMPDVWEDTFVINGKRRVYVGLAE